MIANKKESKKPAQSSNIDSQSVKQKNPIDLKNVSEPSKVIENPQKQKILNNQADKKDSKQAQNKKDDNKADDKKKQDKSNTKLQQKEKQRQISQVTQKSDVKQKQMQQINLQKNQNSINPKKQVKNLQRSPIKIENKVQNNKSKEQDEYEQGDDVLKLSGILDAYQQFLKTLCKYGLPTGDIYEFAAQQIEKFQRKKIAKELKLKAQMQIQKAARKKQQMQKQKELKKITKL